MGLTGLSHANQIWTNLADFRTTSSDLYTKPMQLPLDCRTSNTNFDSHDICIGNRESDIGELGQ